MRSAATCRHQEFYIPALPSAPPRRNPTLPISAPATAEPVDLPRPPSRVQGIKSGFFCAIKLVHRPRPVFALIVPCVQKLESTNKIPFGTFHALLLRAVTSINEQR